MFSKCYEYFFSCYPRHVHYVLSFVSFQLHSKYSNFIMLVMNIFMNVSYRSWRNFLLPTGRGYKSKWMTIKIDFPIFAKNIFPFLGKNNNFLYLMMYSPATERQNRSYFFPFLLQTPFKSAQLVVLNEEVNYLIQPLLTSALYLLYRYHNMSAALAAS